MSARKQIALILVGMAVLLAALGILLILVLHQSNNPTEKVVEETVSEQSSTATSRTSRFPPVTFVSVPENHASAIPALPPAPDNFEPNCPPPSADQLQPGATEEVGYLTYAKPAFSLNDSRFIGTGGPLLAQYEVPYVENRVVDCYEVELVSIEEALEADNLILWWQYDMGMRGKVQPPFLAPVQYYRVKDYEPVTVMGVCVISEYVPRWFAIRDGVIQTVTL